MNQIIEIDNLNIPELTIYSKYSESQLLHYYEPNGGLFIAESPIVIERALNAGYEPVSFLMEKKHIATQEILMNDNVLNNSVLNNSVFHGSALCGRELLKRCENTPVYVAEYDILTKLTGFELTRGMLCAMKRKHPLPSPEEICRDAKRIVILENVVNPTNVGAIFRSAAALNMDAILLTAGCSDPLYRRAIRVSMGTVFQIPWTILPPYCPNTTGLPSSTPLSQIKSLGFQCIAMALTKASISLDDPKLKSIDRLAVIMGTEGEGLCDQTIADCDYTVKIPMSHSVDSLNVAAASAVAFWELTK